MGDIVHLNIRGLKTESIRKNKILTIHNILGDHNTKILSLQETRLADFGELPTCLKNLKHIYNISICEAPSTDPGSGIVVFVKKTENILIETKLEQGRILYLKIKNQASGEITNFFSVYAKSNIQKQNVESFLRKIDNEIISNKLDNVVICGDFNFVTSTNDRNSNNFSKTDNDYRIFWDNFQVKNDL